MEGEDIAWWRLRALRLTGPPVEDAEAVVGWLGVVQAQDYGPAKWAVAMRTNGVDDAALDGLVADGRILRTHVLRPTWHFVLPADIRWLLDVTGPRIRALSRSRYQQLGLDDVVLRNATEVLGAALQGGNWLTRREAGALWEQAGISIEGQRLPYLLMHAELEQVVCSGGFRGREHTYALLDERAPDARRLTPEEGLAELTRRYFTSHGPATAKDFRAWASLTAAQVREGLALVTDDLERQQVGEQTYWFGEPRAPRASAPSVQLLQGYDEYVMGYRDSRWVIDVTGVAADCRHKPVSTGVAVVDSQVAGHWRRTVRTSRVTVGVVLYRRLTEAQRSALETEARRFGAFLGLDAEVTTADG